MKLTDDIGYRETEAELARLELELQRLYGTASVEMQQKAAEYMESLREAAAEMQAKVKRGEISKKECQRWLESHLLTANRYQKMADVLATDMLNVNMIAASIMNGHMPEVYAINMNYMTYCIETATKINTMFTLYNRQTVERIVRENPDLLPVAKVDIAKDLRWSKQHINSAVTQGIVQGDSIPEIAARLRDVSDMDLRASIRNARTMTTSAQNGGRLDSMKRVEKMGARLNKIWLATLDNRTRHCHRQLDGQVRKVGEYFDSELGKIMMPGDQNASPANVYNCRCAVQTDDPEFPLDASDLSLRYSKKLEGQSYEEWKKGHAKRESKKKRVNPDNPAY